MYHYRKTRSQYRAYPKPASCQFCNPQEMDLRKVAETAHAYVIKNRTFYDMWEMGRVLDHLMIIPKQHVGSLADLPDAAKVDIMTLIGTYESSDYNVYARAVANKQRSVEHQHTHLIRTTHKRARLLLHVPRPYLLIKL